MKVRTSLTLATTLVISFTFAAAQAPVKRTTAPQTSAASGKEMYRAYCASCHGLEGKGDGPAATSTKVPPTDLTQLSKNNGGKFPSSHVYEVINGRASTAAHGSADMPVWGPVFRRISQSHDDEVRLRIKNVTDYIQSLQK